MLWRIGDVHARKQCYKVHLMVEQTYTLWIYCRLRLTDETLTAVVVITELVARGKNFSNRRLPYLPQGNKRSAITSQHDWVLVWWAQPPQFP